MPDAMPDRYLTTREGADLRGVTERTVRRWCDDHLLPGAVKIGRDWVIPEKSLKNFTPRPAGNPNWQSKE